MASWAFFIVLWQVIAAALGARVLPSPQAVAAAFGDDWSQLLVHVAYSTARVVASVCAAVLIAVPVATLLGMAPLVDRAVFPVLYALYALPKVVFLPLVVVTLGVGEVSKVVIIGLVIGFQMVVPVRDAVRRISDDHLALMRQMGATREQTWRLLVLPAVMPAVATSLRLAIGTALAVLYIAEFTASSHGLGYYISLNASVLLNYPAVYAGAALLGCLGVTLFGLVAIFERRYSAKSLMS